MFKDYKLENEALAEMIVDLIDNAPTETDLTECFEYCWQNADLNGILDTVKAYTTLGRIIGIVDVCELYGIEVEGLDALREFYTAE